MYPHSETYHNKFYCYENDFRKEVRMMTYDKKHLQLTSGCSLFEVTGVAFTYDINNIHIFVLHSVFLLHMFRREILIFVYYPLESSVKRYIVCSKSTYIFNWPPVEHKESILQ